MQTRKHELRVWAKQKRRRRDKTKDLILARMLKESPVYKEANNILLYSPLREEINLLSLLKDTSKKFYLPKIEGRNLLCCPYCEGDTLSSSCFNTKEPLSAPVDKNLIDLVIIPALCCDRNNYRLGYGGGFYDRFLENYTGKKVVCIPQELIVDTVFPEPHDIPADLIITC